MLAKGTSHTGMKKTRAKTTMITSASSDVDHSHGCRVGGAFASPVFSTNYQFEILISLVHNG